MKAGISVNYIRHRPIGLAYMQAYDYIHIRNTISLKGSSKFGGNNVGEVVLQLVLNVFPLEVYD